MNDKTREAVETKMGKLMMANAELGATNEMLIELVHKQKADLDDKDRQLAIMKGELDRWQSKAAPVVDIEIGEGAEHNGAGVH